jgi:hypothetical protein
MKKPQIANLKGQSFQVGKLDKQRASLLIDDTDFVRRTTVGREETRDLRHCSRSGAYTYSESNRKLVFNVGELIVDLNITERSENFRYFGTKLRSTLFDSLRIDLFLAKFKLPQVLMSISDRQESLISGWDHRFLKRSMCGGLWTNISSSPTKKPYVPTLLCQEFV